MAEEPQTVASARPQGRPYPPPATGETALPAQLTVLCAIALQLLLPERLTAGPRWLMPALEGVLLAGPRRSPPRASSSTSTHTGAATRSP